MTQYHSGIPSAAQVSGHPIHPMLIPFPIAYLVGALLTDLAFLRTDDPFWARASLWLIGAGLVMGVLAAVFGMIDFYARRAIREHRIAWHHFIGNATVLVLALINFLMRNQAPVDGLEPGGVWLSLFTAGILVYTGWLGGELAYRYRVGSIPLSATAPTAYNVGRAPGGQERRAGERRAHLAT